MDHIEQEVRAQLGRAVETTPLLPGLADRVIRSGRRQRRLRTAAVTGTVLAAVVLAGVQLVPTARDRAWTSPATPSGPPKVPFMVVQGTSEILDWNDGTLRSRSIGEALPITAVPAGVLLVTGGATAELALLPETGTSSQIIARGLEPNSVAVADNGDRVSVVSGVGAQRRLRELQVPSGRELRSVSVGPPLVAIDEPVLPVGYSGSQVLLTLGEGTTRRTALWDPGDDQVIGTLDGFTSALGGTSSDGDGRAAFTVDDDRCGVAVVQLRNGMPSWPLCREHFAGFSPDGEAVLSTNATDDALIVHDSDDGDTERTLPVPSGLRAYGWESNGTVLYTTVHENATVIIRCMVKSGRCQTAATYPGTDRIPQPLPGFGN